MLLRPAKGSPQVIVLTRNYSIIYDICFLYTYPLDIVLELNRSNTMCPIFSTTGTWGCQYKRNSTPFTVTPSYTAAISVITP